jgi:ABC-type antimicrobial peptide transport system permease subunit
MSYNVSSRAREFAVRLALGSDPFRLGRLVLRRGAWLSGIGLIAGTVITEPLLMLVGDLPIGGRPNLLVYLSMAGLLLTIALAACAIPALRVANVNPVTALRQE